VEADRTDEADEASAKQGLDGMKVTTSKTRGDICGLFHQWDDCRNI
jgi:hypothetical protein